MDPITLTTDRLRLRNFVVGAADGPDDTDAVHALCQDPDIRRWTTVPDPYTRQDAELFLQRLVPDGWRDDTEYAFAVEPLAGGPLLAAASLSGRGEGVWEVGYWLAAEHRGNGYMTEIVRALAHWAFTQLGCVRLVWRAEVGNAPSRAVAERVGFVVEGVQRAGLVNKGTLRDCWVAALLPSDFGLPSPLPYLPAPERP
ncbi:MULTISPECIES: GNAT family N-acetyltransferase [unclassified Streptomyces]|uniref:GNAT family N-acetyltransferase n=1 Tax=unclassified Streptomyces TaxID=2593676 RepID=UPI0016602A5D|nr:MULTISPECIES: GNAT family N-acetyltransferase [unclassified Streptomyces]MBD0712134.1 GNAT family N-acetyltransferase [Streptomyces sp. CBMA291]MBD0716977.1 GNAT family N-acetyltransferase [Streptomyces sp. CBMA370]